MTGRVEMARGREVELGHGVLKLRRARERGERRRVGARRMQCRERGSAEATQGEELGIGFYWGRRGGSSQWMSSGGREWRRGWCRLGGKGKEQGEKRKWAGAAGGGAEIATGPQGEEERTRGARNPRDRDGRKGKAGQGVRAGAGDDAREPASAVWGTRMEFGWADR